MNLLEKLKSNSKKYLLRTLWILGFALVHLLLLDLWMIFNPWLMAIYYALGLAQIFSFYTVFWHSKLRVISLSLFSLGYLLYPMIGNIEFNGKLYATSSRLESLAPSYDVFLILKSIKETYRELWIMVSTDFDMYHTNGYCYVDAMCSLATLNSFFPWCIFLVIAILHSSFQHFYKHKTTKVENKTQADDEASKI